MIKPCILLFCLLVSSLLLVSDFEKKQLLTEEYAVYSAFLNGIEKNSNDGKMVKLVVINRHTRTAKSFCSEDSIAKYDERIINDELKPLFENLKTKSNISIPLERLLEIKHDYIYIDQREFESFFMDKDMRDWDDFYKKYPNSSGYISLSRVGFNTSFTKAIMFREESCNMLCGSGDYILFEKKNGVWKEMGKFNCWIS